MEMTLRVKKGPAAELAARERGPLFNEAMLAARQTLYRTFVSISRLVRIISDSFRRVCTHGSLLSI